jgi:hypothetical protein
MTTGLFGEFTLEGVVVELDRGCLRCGGNALVIVGPGAGPHAAALACPHCHRNGGWLPKGAASFITECIKQFGPPAGPIIVRNDATRAASQRIISDVRESEET